MPSDLELVRQIGSFQADLDRMAMKLDLLHRAAEAAPTRAQFAALKAKGKRFHFHQMSREDIRAQIARMTALVSELCVLLNDLRARYFPERHVWDRMPSQEMIRALQDSTLERQVKADREKQLNTSFATVTRMKQIKTARKKQASGFAALFNVIA